MEDRHRIVIRDKIINIRATEMDKKALTILSSQLGLSRSEVIRNLIRSELERRALGPIFFLKDFTQFLDDDRKVPNEN